MLTFSQNRQIPQAEKSSAMQRAKTSVPAFNQSESTTQSLSRGLGNHYLLPNMNISTSQHPSSRDEGDSNLAISGSGDPTVTTTYTPESSDKSTKIVFLQVVQTSLDGTAVKPGTANAGWSHLDADTTGDFYVVDYLSGETDPYYNGDDAQDPGTQGNATSSPKVNATTTDTPNYSDGKFPAGKTKFTAEFRTIAFSAAGADKGKFYAYTHWTYKKDKGAAGSIVHQGNSTDTSLPKSKAAINLWCKNHGFALPS